MPCFSTAKEEPIFHPQFGWTHCVFGEIIINLDTTVMQVLELLIPLPEGVVERFA